MLGINSAGDSYRYNGKSSGSEGAPPARDLERGWSKNIGVAKSALFGENTAPADQVLDADETGAVPTVYTKNVRARKGKGSKTNSRVGKASGSYDGSEEDSEGVSDEESAMRRALKHKKHNQRRRRCEEEEEGDGYLDDDDFYFYEDHDDADDGYESNTEGYESYPKTDTATLLSMSKDIVSSAVISDGVYIIVFNKGNRLYIAETGCPMAKYILFHRGVTSRMSRRKLAPPTYLKTKKTAKGIMLASVLEEQDSDKRYLAMALKDYSKRTSFTEKVDESHLDDNDSDPNNVACIYQGRRVIVTSDPIDYENQLRRFESVGRVDTPDIAMDLDTEDEEEDEHRKSHANNDGIGKEPSPEALLDVELGSPLSTPGSQRLLETPETASKINIVIAEGVEIGDTKRRDYEKEKVYVYSDLEDDDEEGEEDEEEDSEEDYEYRRQREGTSPMANEGGHTKKGMRHPNRTIRRKVSASEVTYTSNKERFLLEYLGGCKEYLVVRESEVLLYEEIARLVTSVHPFMELTHAFCEESMKLGSYSKRTIGTFKDFISSQMEEQTGFIIPRTQEEKQVRQAAVRSNLAQLRDHVPLHHTSSGISSEPRDFDIREDHLSSGSSTPSGIAFSSFATAESAITAIQEETDHILEEKEKCEENWQELETRACSTYDGVPLSVFAMKTLSTEYFKHSEDCVMLMESLRMLYIICTQIESVAPEITSPKLRTDIGGFVIEESLFRSMRNCIACIRKHESALMRATITKFYGHKKK